MTSTANPRRTQVIEEIATALKEGDTIYGIFNDPAFFEPKFQSGELHPVLRENILDTPLYTTPGASEAKRYMTWQNEQRASEGTVQKYGNTILRTRDLTPWRDVKGAELEAIDDGRRANG